MQGGTPSYCDRSFRPLSALLSGPQSSVALIEAGRFRTGTFGKRWPIHLTSISTIKTPACLATRNLKSGFATVAAEGHGEAALHSCAEVPPPSHDRSKLAPKPPGILALAFLKSREPQARLDALATKLIGLGKRRGGNFNAAAFRRHPIRFLNPPTPTCADRSK